METKICTYCKEEKQLEEFLVNFRYKGGHINICNSCRSKYNSLYNTVNKEKLKVQHKKYNATDKAIKKRNEYLSREDVKERARIRARKWKEEHKKHNGELGRTE